MATDRGLSYYGASFIAIGETVEFPLAEAFPIWALSVGDQYVDDYVMQPELGGGMYLEYHMDLPHFHMPLSKDAGGTYILGKKMNDMTYRLTAFEIPYGYAIYTCTGALHNDAGLYGPLLVGYNYSVAFPQPSCGQSKTLQDLSLRNTSRNRSKRFAILKFIKLFKKVCQCLGTM
eukprot:TRINITY_DN440_c0_g1_i1.p1 TRINITY_DN440_c0_g1~~TRINITY_DN440_c0_g1_i1.p1  ORF type:complete len:191 (-),score=30.44 TRINITY_DN440_c0_g1_i1:404-928(-)